MPWYFDNRENFCISRRAWNVVKNSWIPLAWENMQPTFRDAATGFPAKWRLSKKRRNSTLMMRHYPDLGSASDWMEQIINQSGVLLRSGYWHVISMEFLRSFLGQACGGVAKCWLFLSLKFLLLKFLQHHNDARSGKVVQFYSCSFSF